MREPYLSSDPNVDPLEPESFFHGRQQWCPWCEDWFPLEVFTQLQTPPRYEHRCPPIYKHGGEGGCKSLFSIFEGA